MGFLIYVVFVLFGAVSMQIWPNLFQSARSVLYFGIGRLLSGEKGNSKETKMGK